MTVRPRLVYERWTDPVAGDILEVADVDVVELDLDAPAQQGWAALEFAHGYQVATRTDETVLRWWPAPLFAGEPATSRFPTLTRPAR